MARRGAVRADTRSRKRTVSVDQFLQPVRGDYDQSVVVAADQPTFFERADRARDAFAGAVDQQRELGEHRGRSDGHSAAGAGLAQQFGADPAAHRQRRPFREPPLRHVEPGDEDARDRQRDAGIIAHQREKIRIGECANAREFHSHDIVRPFGLAKQTALAEQIAVTVVLDHAHPAFQSSRHHPRMPGDHQVNLGGGILAVHDGGARAMLADARFAADDVRKLAGAGEGPRNHRRRFAGLVAGLLHALRPLQKSAPGLASGRLRLRQPAPALLLALAAAAPAQAEVRAVFVGIDTYKFSTVQPEGGEFRDLRGAVNDAQRIKAALNAAYGYGFADPPLQGCPVFDPAQRSVMLLNDCATRDAILGTIGGQIDAANPGDTLIIYLAGHGARLLDMNSDQPGSQASGKNSTFLPYDARDPANAVQGDILDVELGNLIDKALARGVNVLSIADSCSSGTVVRARKTTWTGSRSKKIRTGRSSKQQRIRVEIDVMSRKAPALHGHRNFAPEYHGLPRGHSVALAASRDNELSYERRHGPKEQVGGAFTSALIDAIRQNKNGTFIDLMSAVSGSVTSGERAPRQHPQTEGATMARLTRAGLGLPADNVHVLDVTQVGGKLFLTSNGSFSGIAPGSSLSLFASASDALHPAAKPLAAARVAEVQPYRALLELVGAANKPLPAARLYAREVRARFAGPPIALRLDPLLEDSAQAATRKRIVAALNQSGLARLDGEPRARLAFEPADKSTSLLGPDGALIAPLGPVAAHGFGERLSQALTRLARVDDLLARQPGPPGSVAMCIVQQAFDPAECGVIGGVQSGGQVTLAANAPAQLVLVNLAEEQRYLTVLAVGRDNSIRVVIPKRGGHDVALGQNTPLVQTIALGAESTVCRYLAIATDQPLDTAAFVQDGTWPGLDPAACGGSIERAASPRAAGSIEDPRGGPATEDYWDKTAEAFWAMIAAGITVGNKGETSP